MKQLELPFERKVELPFELDKVDKDVLRDYFYQRDHPFFTRLYNVQAWFNDYYNIELTEAELDAMCFDLFSKEGE